MVSIGANKLRHTSIVTSVTVLIAESTDKTSRVTVHTSNSKTIVNLLQLTTITYRTQLCKTNNCLNYSIKVSTI